MLVDVQQDVLFDAITTRTLSGLSGAAVAGILCRLAPALPLVSQLLGLCLLVAAVVQQGCACAAWDAMEFRVWTPEGRAANEATIGRPNQMACRSIEAR